jgi:hypothetical protein
MAEQPLHCDPEVAVRSPYGGSSRPCLVADTVVALVPEPSEANVHG